MSNNLDLPQVAASQDSKEITINNATGGIDAAFTELLSVDLSSADQVLSDANFRSAYKFTATGNTVSRNLTVPAIKRPFVVDNAAGTATLNVVRGSTTIAIAAGENGQFYTDGTTNGLIQIGGGGAGGGISGVGIEDDGVEILSAATRINFAGAGVVTTDGGSNEATVTIAGGGGGIDLAGFKEPVRAATTAAGTLATSFEDGDTLDGITLSTGDRILIKDQAAGAENGIYTVNASGAPTRSTNFDEDAEVPPGLIVSVADGSTNGDTVWVLTTDGTITVGTTALVFEEIASVVSTPYDVGSFFPGVPGSSELLLRFVFSRAVVFPAGLTNSQGFLGVAATASTAIDIQKNGASVGTMTFAAAGTTATFTFSTETTFLSGDRLELVAPGTADATAADISFTLAGTR